MFARTLARPARILLPLLLTTIAASSASAQGVTWADLSVDAALAQAATEGKLVFIDVYADWCGPCHRLEAEVFPTAEAGTATADLVTIRINAEQGEGPQVVERFHVVGYPTLLLVQPDGVEVDRIFGFMPTNELVTTLQGYREGRGTIADLRTQVAADPSNLALVYELGFRAAVRGEYAEAQPLLDRIIAEDPDNALGLRVQAHHTLGKYMYLRGMDNYAGAIEQFRILQEQFPGSDEADDAAIQSAIAYARSGDQTSAQAALDAYIAQNPTDSGYYNSVAWACYRENFNLPGAIVIAQRGLEVNPNDDALWDTLAEVQNANGDPVAALESARRALAINPTEPYYQQQVVRFEQLVAALGAPIQ